MMGMQREGLWCAHLVHHPALAAYSVVSTFSVVSENHKQLQHKPECRRGTENNVSEVGMNWLLPPNVHSPDFPQAWELFWLSPGLCLGEATLMCLLSVYMVPTLADTGRREVYILRADPLDSFGAAAGVLLQWKQSGCSELSARGPLSRVSLRTSARIVVI